MIPEKTFGRTEHISKRIIFGAAALAKVTQKEADKTLETLLQYGINHIDVAASYGEAELRVGPWMKNHRSKFFLATKTEMRTYAEAKAELSRSLKKLQTDRIDLWQMHFLVNPEEWETAMGPDGALKAFIEARDQGLVRFLGVTGHGLITPSIHCRSLEHFEFDSVLLPYNFSMMQLPQYAEDYQRLSELCREKNVAMQTIKSLARGPLGEQKTMRSTWYDPIENENAIEHSVHWVLGNPQVFLNTVSDIQLLSKVLELADRYQSMPSDDVMKEDMEQFGITPLFTD
jgi:aryl-alcohol dehydrogenase-like predicted oxidoreductase